MKNWNPEKQANLKNYGEKANRYTFVWRKCVERQLAKIKAAAKNMLGLEEGYMNDDHMRNGQLKPGYNVQFAVNSKFITGIGIYADRTDYDTLPPLDTLEEKHGMKYQRVVTDAGYESLKKLNMDRITMKCYMGDTGLLISHAFDENGIVSEEIYRKLLFDKLEVNTGMIMENLVAQMLAAAGHQLYFYANSDRVDSESRMEIDFLISKSKVSSRHNTSPIEVKSSKNYTLSSLRKFMKK